VEFMPDISGGLTFEYGGTQVRGGIYNQSYKAEGGRVTGHYADGTAAVVEHTYGSGKTLLVGTFPSAGYYHTHDSGNLDYFSKVLGWAGVNLHVKLSDSSLQARLCRGTDDALFIWILNPHREQQRINIELSDTYGTWSADNVYWGGTEAWSQHGTKLQVSVPGRDAVIIRLKPGVE
jgi:beta-galactosidase